MEINKDLIAASSTPIVLAILAEGDSYGYAILQRVRELSGGQLAWTDGMLYPVLHRLERLGHVEARWEVRGERPAAQVLPDHAAGPGAARRGAPAVAGGGRDAAGHLAGARPSPCRPAPGVGHAAAAGSLTMPTRITRSALEEQIDQWRSYLRRRQAIHAVDVAELEDHLREQVAALVDAGLATDEAFLVAVKRMGDLDALSRGVRARALGAPLEAARRRPRGCRRAASAATTDAIVAFASRWRRPCRSRCRRSSGSTWTSDAGFYARNLSLFVLPLLTGYFAWKRRLDAGTLRWLAAAFVAAGVFANVYPFAPGGSTEALAALHLPIALWLVVGIAYAGGRWSQVAGRMDFIRFSGELFIYYVLIALGGGVLTAFLLLMFQTIGIDAEPFVASLAAAVRRGRGRRWSPPGWWRPSRA